MYIVGRLTSAYIFKGIVRFHRIFNYALTASEVATLWNGGEPERRVVEFGPQADWGEQTFTFAPVTGARQVTFLFLPGTQFDFDNFTFI